jgi:hypothetical protein
MNFGLQRFNLHTTRGIRWLLCSILITPHTVHNETRFNENEVHVIWCRKLNWLLCSVNNINLQGNYRLCSVAIDYKVSAILVNEWESYVFLKSKNHLFHRKFVIKEKTNKDIIRSAVDYLLRFQNSASETENQFQCFIYSIYIIFFVAIRSVLGKKIYESNTNLNNS